MTKNEAFALLRIADTATEDEIDEALEEQRFAIQKEVLGMEVVPRVFMARITKLQRLEEAESVLFNEAFPEDFPKKSLPFPTLNQARLVLDLETNTTLKTAISTFEKKWSYAKLLLAQSDSNLSLAQSIKTVSELQYAFESIVLSLLSTSFKSVDLVESKLNKPLNSAVLNRILESYKLGDKLIGADLGFPIQEMDQTHVLMLQKEYARVERSKALAR